MVIAILDIKKPKKCIWYEDGQDYKCPLLDDSDCCRGQGNEANSAANDWDDLMKGCPIKGELVRCGECKYYEKFNSWCAYCKKVDSYISNENWYCADGERKEQTDASD